MGTNPTELKRNMLLKDIRGQIRDEDEAHSMYSGMAAVARELGFGHAATLERIALEESNHKATLEIMLQALSKPSYLPELYPARYQTVKIRPEMTRGKK